MGRRARPAPVRSPAACVPVRLLRQSWFIHRGGRMGSRPATGLEVRRPLVRLPKGRTRLVAFLYRSPETPELVTKSAFG